MASVRHLQDDKHDEPNRHCTTKQSGQHNIFQHRLASHVVTAEFKLSSSTPLVTRIAYTKPVIR
jgi:hypothetical protein